MTDPRSHEDVVSSLQSASLQSLRELVALSGQVGPAVARRAHLSRSELNALELLMDADLGPVELARKLGLTSAAASGIVDRLEAYGHVNRIPHRIDGRRVSVVITDSARAEVIGHLMPMFLSLAELDARLSDEERAVVDRYLREAVDAIRRLL